MWSVQRIVYLYHTQIQKEVGKETIAKETLQGMELAGVNTSIFKGHLTRMSGTSKALDKGVSVDEVMRAGHWKSRYVFDLFYNRSKHLDMGQLLLQKS
jgi:hypothetical protein